MRESVRTSVFRIFWDISEAEIFLYPHMYIFGLTETESSESEWSCVENTEAIKKCTPGADAE